MKVLLPVERVVDRRGNVKSAQLFVAINHDADALILNVADCRPAADLSTVVLTERL